MTSNQKTAQTTEKRFTAIKIKTRGYRFSRDDANARKEKS